ncbi:MAG TPA: hypothetical protein VN900_09015 [Stellaceae bacterium]|jgi:hypothetical protein|nr:hypothetical protein [Stellaceae bacterium]
MATPTVIRAENLGETMNDIRTWLDAEKIEPVDFKTVVSHAGIGFEISFETEQEAERFQERFASLVPC